MQYKVYECEEQVTKTGKKLKKLVLKVEGQENTEPRVTLWEDHPEYAQAAAGGTINGVLEKKDSGVPIPAHPGKIMSTELYYQKELKHYNHQEI